MKKNTEHLTINQLQELTTGDYVWFQIKLMGVRGFKNQKSMDKQVSEYCTLKHLKEFLNRFQVVSKSDDLMDMWEQVKVVIKKHNR